MHHYTELKQKYEHTLDAMWALFNFGRDREEVLEAKLFQIRQICQSSKADEDKVAFIEEVTNER